MNTAKHKMLEFYLSKYPEDAYVTVMKYPIGDIVELIQEFSPQQIVSLLNVLPVFILSEALKKVETAKTASLLSLMNINLVSRVLRKWSDDGFKEKYNDTLSLISPKLRKRAEILLSYGKDTIGFMMNPTPLAIAPNLTIGDVLTILGQEKNRYSRYIYIVDTEKKLLGVLPFKDAFYSSNKDELISKSMSTDVYSVSPSMKASDIYLDHIWSRWDSLPVVDRENRLLGVVKYDVLDEYCSTQPKRARPNSVDIAGGALADIVKIGFKGSMDMASALLRPGDINEKD